MPTPTYTLIASTTLATSVFTVSFTGIDQTFGDLVFVCTPVGNNIAIRLKINGDTGSNYSFVNMTANGTAGFSGSGTATSLTLNVQADVQATPGLIVNGTIFDYTATDKHKSVLVRASNGNDGVNANAGRWANTSAVTSILFESGNQFTSGSTFYIYGIEK
tara:strand:- start:216 stop:698 length:483 start_codon:yes stop_codon:yes gene_type:complete